LDCSSLYREDLKISIVKINKRKKFYENFFMIKKWKDKIPQYIGKGGFSKKRFKSCSVSYIKEFISETYRGEFDHAACCAIIPVLFFLASAKVAVLFSLFIILINFPCIFIQRYNRVRLRRILLRKTSNLIDKNTCFNSNSKHIGECSNGKKSL
jgi:glycosyl-4,4'-diaponeurosporenoate acyltransferase